ncbi:MAG: hypothetical protein R3C49_12045 [Planctomycetaceae bacterium]
MESPRGGPLTTFIMMLPLIIVPTIAMLKPADSGQGLVSTLLSAATGKPGSPSAISDQPASDPADEFAELFQEDAPSAPPADQESVEASLFREAAGTALADDFPEFSRGVPETAPAGNASNSVPRFGEISQQPPVNDATVQRLQEQLRQLGVTKTLWYSGGPQVVGFVAFLQPAAGIVSYRFEATAASETAAMMDVVQQIQSWQNTRGQ